MSKKFFLGCLPIYFILATCDLHANEDEIFENLLSQGITAFKNAKPEVAAKCFEECAKIDPSSYLPPYWMGMLHGNRPDLAEQAFDYAIKLAPAEPGIYAIRGYLNLGRSFSATSADQGAGYLMQSIADIDKALCLDPNNIQACYYKAIQLMRFGHHDRAIAYFALVVAHTVDKEEFLEKRSPQNYRQLAYFNLAEVYFYLQSFDKSLENIDKAIELAIKPRVNNDFLVACYRLRYQANYQVNKKKAVMDLEKIIEYKPTSFNTLTYQKVLLLLEMNLVEEATVLCRTMLQSLSLDDHARVIYIFSIGFKCNRIEEATEYIDTHNEKKFREDYQKGLVSKDDLRFFYETRCFLNIARNKLTDAYKDISSKIDLDPKNNSREYLIRTIILLLMDKKEEARIDFDSYLPLLRVTGFPIAPLTKSFD